MFAVVRQWSGFGRRAAKLRERRAAVVIIFALVLLPLIGLIGLAVDFGFITQAKAQLDLAADTAALTATTTAANAYLTNKPNPLGLGQAAGLQWFTAQTGLLMDGSIPSTVAPVINVSQNGGNFSTTVSYTARVENYFGRIFGIDTSAVSGTSVASIPTNPYTNISFLLDNSSSMLVASTDAGILQLNGITQAAFKLLNVPNDLGGKPCAFACHWDADNLDYYGIATGKIGTIAAKLGLPLGQKIQLRFDVMQSAVQTSVQSMQQLQQIPQQFSLSVYTFDNTLNQAFPTNLAQSASSDLAAGANAVAALTTPVVIDQANTDFPTIMATLAQVTTPAGDGSTAANPKKSLIIVTDGMADYGPRTLGTSRGPINPDDCTAMKAKQYSIYVLYTTYSSQPTALLNNTDLLPYLSGGDDSVMSQRLRACASTPANFIQASDPASIAAAMAKLLQSALNTGGRFTQ